MAEEEKQGIHLHINDALYNAGLLGLYRVLNRMPADSSGEPYYRLDSENLIVRQEAFSEEFTKAYFEELIDRYGSDTVYENLIKELEWILSPNAREAEDFPKKLKKCISSLCEKLKRNSYTAGFEILRKYYNTKYDFWGIVKSIKNEENQQKQLNMLQELYEQMKQEDVRHVLCLKDIVYTRVQNYWTGVSFLYKDKTKNKEPFEQAFSDYFLVPIATYKPKKGKKVMPCFQCGRALQAKASSTAWVNDTMPDVKRKTDSFWNYVPDIMMCPYCMLVYACVPLGFTTFASEGVFVNDCRSIRTLNTANNFPDSSQDLQKDAFAEVINQFLLTADETQAENWLQNVQVVRRSGDTYRVNTLTADMLEDFVGLKGTLGKLLKANPYLFHQTLEHILNGQELYGLMLQGYRNSLEQGYGLGIYNWLLEIQIKMFCRKRDKEAVKTQMSLKSQAYRAGAVLKARIWEVNIDTGKQRANGKRLIGVTYRLLNALQGDNQKLFFDTIERLYMSFGFEIPKIFFYAIHNDENFQVIGHAFVQGLNSASKENKTNEENKGEDKA